MVLDSNMKQQTIQLLIIALMWTSLSVGGITLHKKSTKDNFTKVLKLIRKLEKAILLQFI